MFEVNGGYQADAAAGTMGGSKKILLIRKSTNGQWSTVMRAIEM